MHIMPWTDDVSFAKALNRQVVGSMNELVMAAATSIKFGETAAEEVSTCLNDLQLSAIATKDDWDNCHV